MFHCPLTDIQFQGHAHFITEPNSPVFHYRFHPVGEAMISMQALAVIRNQPTEIRRLLAGICRNKHAIREKPFLIESTSWSNNLKEFNIPIEFEEKQALLLKHIYRMSAGNTKKVHLQSNIDYTLIFSADKDEFDHILDSTQEEGFLEWDLSRILGGRIRTISGIRLTKEGREEVKRSMPQIPLIGLVSQKITTGDIKVDDKIEQAKRLFFSHPENMENMRNACETLCFILEPLRKDLQEYFSNSDVNAFFQIVNDFDIRHNKPHTKQLVYKEQLEWVFYSLLNTITTYVKLNSRLQSQQ